MTTPPRLIDFHSHWGTERGWRGSPYQSAADREALRGYFKWDMGFVGEDEQAAQFRRANARVVLDFAFTHTMDAAALRDQHDYAFDYARSHSDVVLGNWIGIDPTQPGHVRELERCLREGPGLTGLAVHSFTPAGPADQPAWRPCLRLCAEAGRPVLMPVGMSATGAGTRGGMGVTLQDSHPRYVDHVAAAHPDLDVIAARVAWPWQPEMIAIALHKANVWLELHGWSPRYFPGELKHEIAKRLRKRVFFGADYPMLSHERLVQDWRDQGFAPDVLEDVFTGNAESYLASIGVR
ncbi:amidohydrolase family protein [Amycolatopsis sp. PS_44_ISF1]|uniref:amidohydrolase family protein n=1 Tax=Amycolatopsis sp. PS_44_ISF1 TaxID=2974917 RepID=UPI0028DE85F8|nr:amidohydrolase family protein [Amycolatopsis sp. PS_44_ISF1]MDT8914988.1 amidohydrolase family protein [Amycolatopsis sp. PS_44_ISF1]